jgi:hypothetical protein
MVMCFEFRKLAEMVSLLLSHNWKSCIFEFFVSTFDLPNDLNVAEKSVSGMSEFQKYSSIALNITPALSRSYGKYETSPCSQIGSTTA